MTIALKIKDRDVLASVEKWPENHQYKKTPLYLRDAETGKFLSSLYPYQNSYLFEFQGFYGSLSLPVGPVIKLTKTGYWKLFKLIKSQEVSK